MDNEYLSGLYSNVDGNTAISLSGGFGVPVPTGPGVPDGLSVQPMRHRRSGLEQGLLMAKDVFDSISGLDPNAYLGKTAELANRYDTTRMEEDPEGKAIDYNRAKILSQRAYATKDPEMKKKYGAAIKRLLPRETQGLDDLTASEFLISSEKMEIEKLKAATQLAKEKMKGEYSLEKTDKQNENKITIQDMKNAATQEHDALQYDLKMALADKDYEKAVMIRDRMDELEEFKKAADYAREEMKQGSATERTNIQQGGANYRANLAAESAERRTAMQQAGAMERVQAQQEGALERAKIMQAGALERAKVSAAAKNKEDTQEKKDAFAMKVSSDRLKEMYDLNESAGRWFGTWTKFGSDVRNSESARDYNKFEGLAKQIVQDQLRKIYGAQFTEKEGERFFKSMGLSPTLDKKTRWELFMNAINDLRIKNGYAAIDPETFKEVGTTQTSGSASASQGQYKKEGKRVF